MSIIREFNFNDFTSAVKNQLGNAFDAKVEENMQGLKSIFDEAAKNDGGENDELFEAYEGGKFNELVKKGVDFVKQQFAEGIVGNVKKLLADIKMSNKIKELEQKMEDKPKTPALATEMIEYFEGRVPEYAVTWYCDNGGSLFDIQNALDEYYRLRQNNGILEQQSDR